jgi:hypothetical protein
MRLSELLDAPVEDADGVAIGSVRDVRLVEDGPLVDGFGHALRVEGVLVGRRWQGIRLGFERAEVTGPWPLTSLFRRLEGRARFYAWEDVAAWEEGAVRLRPGATAVSPPG